MDTLNKFKTLLNKSGIPEEFEPAFMALYQNRLKSNILNTVEFAVVR